MSIKEKLIEAVKDLDSESAEIVLQLVYKLTESVEPEKWEHESIREWESMTVEEREAGSMTHEDLKRELRL